MEKGLLFFTISLGCLWMILDDVYGDKRLSKILQNLTPDFQSMGDKFLYGTKTQDERRDIINEAKKKVDENDGIKTDSAKKAVKDVIDAYYEGTEALRHDRVY